MTEQRRRAQALVEALDRYEEYHDKIDRRGLSPIHAPLGGREPCPDPPVDDVYLAYRTFADLVPDRELPRDGQKLWDRLYHLTREPPNEKPLYKSVFATLRKFRTWLVDTFLTDRPRWDGKKLWYGDTLCCTVAERAHRLRSILDALEKANWPPSRAVPVTVKGESFRNAISHLRKKLKGSPIDVGSNLGGVRWYVRAAHESTDRSAREQGSTI